MATRQAAYGTPEYRFYRTANRYGMTVTQLQEMIDKQNNKCIICEEELTAKFNVDHDPDCCENSAKKNTCGKCNRGIMCHSCNIVVGHIENAIYFNRLDKILAYLT